MLKFNVAPYHSCLKGFQTIIHLCFMCLSEDLLNVEGMDMKLTEPVTAGHLINAARLGNSKADAVLNKGQHTHNLLKKFKLHFFFTCITVCKFCYLKTRDIFNFNLSSSSLLHSLHSTRCRHH